MKEQIEKMAKDVNEAIKHNSAVDVIRHGLICVNGDGVARELFDDGYRKQREGEKSKGCEYCKGRAYTKKPLTVITKYGRRIELVFEFCPNCGRKMKGGAE